MTEETMDVLVGPAGNVDLRIDEPTGGLQGAYGSQAGMSTPAEGVAARWARRLAARDGSGNAESYGTYKTYAELMKQQRARRGGTRRRAGWGHNLKAGSYQLSASVILEEAMAGHSGSFPSYGDVESLEQCVREWQAPYVAMQTHDWLHLVIDEAVSIDNFFKLVGHWDEPGIQEQLGVPRVDQALMEALEELRGVQEEAEEEGTAVPSNALVQRAEEALRAIHSMARRTYDVYAMPYGDIVIDIEVPARCKLVVICREDGRFRGLMATDEGKQDEQYGQVKELPVKPFLREALDKLAL